MRHESIFKTRSKECDAEKKQKRRPDHDRYPQKVPFPESLPNPPEVFSKFRCALQPVWIVAQPCPAKGKHGKRIRDASWCAPLPATRSVQRLPDVAMIVVKLSKKPVGTAVSPCEACEEPKPRKNHDRQEVFWLHG